MIECFDPIKTDSSEDLFAGEFIYRFSVPVVIQVLSDVPQAQEAQNIDFSNRILLEVLNTSASPLSNNKDMDTETLQFLTTLSAKLDLLLRWTGQLITDKLSLPSPIDLDINAHGIKLHVANDAEKLTLTRFNLINIYLSGYYPEPLRLYARLINTQSHSDGVVYDLKIEHCSEETQDALEKYIFKVHRQHISSLKKQSQSGETV